jgi:hypothetical protein
VISLFFILFFFTSLRFKKLICHNKLVLEIGFFFEVEKFNDQNSFSLSHIKMHALLRQHGLAKILDGEARSTSSQEEIAELKDKTHSAILLSLLDKIKKKI